jgi:hypothetical protein
MQTEFLAVEGEGSTIRVIETSNPVMQEQPMQAMISHAHQEDASSWAEHSPAQGMQHSGQTIDHLLITTRQSQTHNWLGGDMGDPLDASQQLPIDNPPHLVDRRSSAPIHRMLYPDTAQRDNNELANNGEHLENSRRPTESNFHGIETFPSAPSFFDGSSIENINSVINPVNDPHFAQIDPCLHEFSPGGQFSMPGDLHNWFDQFDSRTHITNDDHMSAIRNGTGPGSETGSYRPEVRDSPLYTRSDSIMSVDSAVPIERFRRVEQCWPHRSGNKTRAMHNLWRDVCLEAVDNLFTEPGGVVEPMSKKQRDSTRCGLDEEARSRLEKTFGRVCPREHLNSNANTVSPSTAEFPPAEIFDMGLDLYFRHFHPLLPFVHNATFDPRCTDVPVLFIMCLIGITLINTNGATNFVQQAFNVSFTEIDVFPGYNSSVMGVSQIRVTRLGRYSIVVLT